MARIEGIDAFDLEGTLALIPQGRYKHPSIWPMLAEALGPDAKAEEERIVTLLDNERLKPNSKHTYLELLEYSFKYHKKYGLTKDLFERVINSVKWIKGIPETFRALKERNRLIVIITGGFANHAERVPGKEYVDHIKGSCRYFFDADGQLERAEVNNYDGMGKVAVIEEICKMHGLDAKKHATSVSDGKNDLPIAQAVGISIALNACPELQNAATYSVNTTTLTDVLPYLLKKV